jgi:hypothetical protein
MELNKDQKKHIEEALDFYPELTYENLEEIHEEILHNMIDDFIIDLSDDEEGDLHMTYSNLVYDDLEERIKKL